jgi:hypothetical protein
MKNSSLLLLIKLSLALCLITFVLTVSDFMALHDVMHDYVSKEVLEAHQTTPIILPEWTDANLEWQWINFSGIIRIGFLLLNTVALTICFRRFSKTSSV